MLAKLVCSNYAGYGATADAYGISAAVRTPPGASIIAISGQTGSNLGEPFGTFEEQIKGAFQVGGVPRQGKGKGKRKKEKRKKGKREKKKKDTNKLTRQNADKALCAACPELSSADIWQCVFSMTFYVVGALSKEVGMVLDAVAKSYLGEHRPAGTAVQVQALAYPECLIELQVQAAVKTD